MAEPARYKRPNRVERIKSQVISMSETARITLELIRSEGIDAVTIRRLAAEMHVKSASLYYHFHNKEEILVLAARKVLEGVRGSGDPNLHWREWLLDNACTARAALLEYPELVPTLMRRHPLGIGVAEHEQAVVLLEAQGMPLGAIMPVFDALESLLYGSVMYTTAVASDDRSADWQEHYPAMHRAGLSADLSPEDAFRHAAGALIDGVVAAVVVPQRNKKTVLRTEKTSQRTQKGSRRSKTA
jgi:TetR/AcrR family transcriptional regulator, tetracycline repressor protein